MDWTQIILTLAGSGVLGAVLGYLTSKRQAALEQTRIEQQVGDALWLRTREEITRLDERADELEAENKVQRKEIDDLRDKNEALEKQVSSLKMENSMLRESNAALKDELQLAKLEQEAANKRHLDSLNELLVANSTLERELRDVRGRMRRVETGETGPLKK